MPPMPQLTAGTVVNQLFYNSFDEFEKETSSQGTFNLLVGNTLDSGNVGNIWVTYDVVLFFPQDGDDDVTTIGYNVSYTAESTQNIGRYMPIDDINSTGPIHNYGNNPARIEVVSATPGFVSRIRVPAAGRYFVCLYTQAADTVKFAVNASVSWANINSDALSSYTMNNQHIVYNADTNASCLAMTMVTVAGAPGASLNGIYFDSGSTSYHHSNAAFLWIFATPSSFQSRSKGKRIEDLVMKTVNMMMPKPSLQIEVDDEEKYVAVSKLSSPKTIQVKDKR